jgi:prevent-host-death family protein
MRIPITAAKGKLSELIRRAEGGDDVILTRRGHAAVQLVPIKTGPDRQSRRALLEAVRASGAAKAIAGPDAAHSQDFLYESDNAFQLGELPRQGPMSSDSR